MIRVQRSGLAMAPSCPFPNAPRLPGNTAKPTINSRLALPYHVMKYGLPQVSHAHDHADSLREYQHQSCRGSFSDGQAGTKHRTEWSWPPAKGTKQFDLSFSLPLSQHACATQAPSRALTAACPPFVVSCLRCMPQLCWPDPPMSVILRHSA
jgi:hypothetical protein